MIKEFISENRQLFLELKNMIFIFLLIVDFVFIFLITFFDLSFDQLLFMTSFDLFICLLLFIHLCYDYKNYDKGFSSFIKEHILDILAVIPFDFIFLRFLAVFRIMNYLQFFQIFKFFRIGSSLTGSLKYFVRNRLLKLLVIVVFMYILFSSVILKNIDPSFSTVFDAFWFNVVTMTSVGYGDITPATGPGKVLSMGSIIMGIVFISIFTAAMASLYMEKPEEETRSHVKKQISKYVKHVEDENRILHDRIDSLEKQNNELNEKLDTVIDILKKKE